MLYLKYLGITVGYIHYIILNVTSFTSYNIQLTLYTFHNNVFLKYWIKYKATNKNHWPIFWSWLYKYNINNYIINKYNNSVFFIVMPTYFLILDSWHRQNEMKTWKN